MGRGLARLGALGAIGAFVACAQLAGLEGPGSDRDPAGGGPQAEPTPGGALGGTKAEEGESTDSALSVATKQLDFGSVACGSAGRLPLVIGNKTKEPKEFTIVVPEGTPFEADDPLTGTVPPNGSVTVSFRASPTVAGTASTNFVITSGASFVTVPVGVLGTGPILEWAAATAEIGDTPLNAEGATTVKLSNTGNGAVNVASFDGQTSDLTVEPKSVGLAPGAQADIAFRLKSGSQPSAALTATIKPAALGLCAPAPSLLASGRRIDTTVTISGGDWGKKACNTTPTDTRDLVVKNYSPNPVKWNVTGAPTTFKSKSGTSGLVNPAAGNTPGQSVITFEAPALGASPVPITETVKVTMTDAAGNALPAPTGGERTLTLKVDVRGAVVAVTPTNLQFRARIGRSDDESFRITNTGNEPASLVWTFRRTAGGPAWTGLPGSTYTYGNNASNVRIGYQPSTYPPNTATLTPSQGQGGGPICNPSALATVTMSGSD